MNPSDTAPPRPSRDLTNIIRLSFSGPGKGTVLAGARPGDDKNAVKPGPYQAYECCAGQKAPLAAFRIIIPGQPTWHIPYHQLRDFESTPAAIRLITPGYTYDVEGFDLDNGAFFDALAEQRLRLIRQWDPLRPVSVPGGHMWITRVQRSENRPRKESEANDD